MTSGDVETAAETAVVEQAAETAGAQVEAKADKPAPKQKQKKKKVRVLPRTRIVKVLSVGMEVEGTVKRVSEFGAFVDIGAGRDGLLHISELSTSRVHKVTDVVQEGQKIARARCENGSAQMLHAAPPSAHVRDVCSRWLRRQ